MQKYVSGISKLQFRDLQNNEKYFIDVHIIQYSDNTLDKS